MAQILNRWNGTEWVPVSNVNDAIKTWDAAAITELEALEATLKADYNRYLDSLAAYVARVKAINDARQSFFKIIQISAAASIKNQAAKYILDNGGSLMPSIHIVNSCDSDKLLNRKQP